MTEERQAFVNALSIEEKAIRQDIKELQEQLHKLKLEKYYLRYYEGTPLTDDSIKRVAGEIRIAKNKIDVLQKSLPVHKNGVGYLYCSVCGFQVSRYANYCSNCGQRCLVVKHNG